MSAADRAWHEAGGRLTVDLQAIAANWRMLADLARPGECAAVVKADAYGLGAAEVGPALWAAGARTFFVALPSEARALRAVLPRAVIYVLGGLTPGSGPVFREIRARPVLGSLPEIEEWGAFVAGGAGGEAAIHVDTGMNRLGLSLGQATAIAEHMAAGTPGFRPSMVMSHLACADEPDHPLTSRQIDMFRDVAARFKGVPASLANSAGTLSRAETRFDLCRPGIALYGGNPLPGRPNPMKSVVTLEARVVQIRTADAGTTIGYSAVQTLQRASCIAIVSLGYADGFLRAAGSSDARSGARTVVAGHSCSLLGRISMDLTALDITDLPKGSVQRGDTATFIGDGISLDEVAEHAGTISYEILTGLGTRYARTYLR